VHITDNKKLIKRWDIRTWHRSILLYRLAFNGPDRRRRGSPGTISVKFCTEVKRWQRYKMAKKYYRKFQPP